MVFNVASLYPILYRLEEQGSISGWWVERAGQRRRRFYRLTPAGRKRLEAWLTSDARGDHSFAASAAAALPFIRKPHRERLMALALDHTDPKVQLEAAWASATIGSAAGVKYLRRLCLSPATSASACSYLRELGRDDLIPKEAMEPQFLAMVDLGTWLASSWLITEP